jgi:hypothetical protein
LINQKLDFTFIVFDQSEISTASHIYADWLVRTNEEFMLPYTISIKFGSYWQSSVRGEDKNLKGR